MRPSRLIATQALVLLAFTIGAAPAQASRFRWQCLFLFTDERETRQLADKNDFAVYGNQILQSKDELSRFVTDRSADDYNVKSFFVGFMDAEFSAIATLPRHELGSILTRAKTRKEKFDSSRYLKFSDEELKAQVRLRNQLIEDYLQDVYFPRARRAHVIDLGAGDLNQSRHLLEPTWPFQKTNLPNVTAITYQMHPEGYENIASIVAEGNGQVFVGKKFEDIPNIEISRKFGAADIIVDVYGVLSYSTQHPLVVQKIAQLLRPGGRLYAPTGKANFIIDDKIYDFAEFLEWTGAFVELPMNHDSNSGARVFVRRNTPAPDLSGLKLMQVRPQKQGLAKVIYIDLGKTRPRE